MNATVEEQEILCGMASLSGYRQHFFSKSVSVLDAHEVEESGTSSNGATALSNSVQLRKKRKRRNVGDTRPRLEQLEAKIVMEQKIFLSEEILMRFRLVPLNEPSAFTLYGQMPGHNPQHLNPALEWKYGAFPILHLKQRGTKGQKVSDYRAYLRPSESCLPSDLVARVYQVVLNDANDAHVLQIRQVGEDITSPHIGVQGTGTVFVELLPFNTIFKQPQCNLHSALPKCPHACPHINDLELFVLGIGRHRPLHYMTFLPFFRSTRSFPELQMALERRKKSARAIAKQMTEIRIRPQNYPALPVSWQMQNLESAAAALDTHSNLYF